MATSFSLTALLEGNEIEGDDDGNVEVEVKVDDILLESKGSNNSAPDPSPPFNIDDNTVSKESNRFMLAYHTYTHTNT